MAAETSPTVSEQKLLDAVKLGLVADYRSADTAINDPATGATWGLDRIIRAEVIYALAVGTNPDWPVHPRGLLIRGARITGPLNFEAAEIHHPLILVSCYIEQPIVLTGASAHSILLTGSHIFGLNGDGLRTRFVVQLDRGFTSKGMVSLIDAHIDGPLQCGTGTFDNPAGAALYADRLSVTGSVFLSNKFRALGEVRLLGAKVGGNFDCNQGTFENPKGIALAASRLVVAGDVLFLDKFRATGEVQLVNAKIGGDLNCSSGRLESQTGVALRADRLTVTGAVFFQKDFRATGEVRLLGARVGGNVEATDGHFENPTGPALSADGLTVDGSCFFRAGFKSAGEVRLLGARVKGDLDCSGGHFEDPRGVALRADGLSVADSIFLKDGFRSSGEVRLVGATVGRDLDCRGGTFEHRAGLALSLDRAKITGALVVESLATPPEGFVSFTHARVGQLIDDAASWPSPGSLSLNGCVYEDIAYNSPISATERLDWLERQPKRPFRPQPYEQLIRVLRQLGREHDVRKIAIAKQVALRKSGELSFLSRMSSRFLGITIGHGYRPSLACVWAVGLVLLGACVFSQAYRSCLMGPSKEGIYLDPKYRCSGGVWKLPPEYPTFSSLVYSLDVFFPVVDLQQKAYWQPHEGKSHVGWVFRRYFWLHTIFGWALTGVVVAWLAGLVKRD